MNKTISSIVVVGGGSAGWLSAAIIAAEFKDDPSVDVTLVESPNVATVGVGEGTWPSMPETLRRIGLSESEFIRRCDASFKQGSKFVGWTRGGQDYYYHPFTPPADYGRVNLAQQWVADNHKLSFSQSVSNQQSICEMGLAPKQLLTPEFAYNLRYGYHLDAGKFTALLQEHCIQNLDVNHRKIDITSVECDDFGYISMLSSVTGDPVAGDFFIDCSGMHSILIGDHYGIPVHDKSSVLFNDCALAVHVPYEDGCSKIASETISQAFGDGWIWNIGLRSRRGVGAVFSRQFSDSETVARELERYCLSLGDEKSNIASPRKIEFTPGYRQKFWHKNCVAIGLSAGFVEPLEATALVLVEQSATMIANQLPRSRNAMNTVAKQFNRIFSHHWERIVDFLKLHYVLSERTDSEYWRAHRDPSSIPVSLSDALEVWRERPPWLFDDEYRSELFSSASFQYVLYGMQPNWTDRIDIQKGVENELQMFLHKNENELKKLTSGLKSNRDLLNDLAQVDFPPR